MRKIRQLKEEAARERNPLFSDDEEYVCEPMPNEEEQEEPHKPEFEEENHEEPPLEEETIEGNTKKRKKKRLRKPTRNKDFVLDGVAVESQKRFGQYD